MFQLTQVEMENWKSQIVMSNKDKMGLRKAPYAFTENGVAILSSMLGSERAVEVHIQVMRTFTRLREMLLTNKELQRKIEDMEKKYDHQFKIVFDAIKQLIIYSRALRRRQLGSGWSWINEGKNKGDGRLSLLFNNSSC